MRAPARGPLSAVITMLAVVAVAACGGTSSTGTKSTATPSAKPKAMARDANVQDAVVHVQSHYPDRISEATGFVYNARRGLVMTANHAVEAAPIIHVLLGDGSPLNGRIVGRAQCHDLAILKLNPVPPDLAQITWGGPVEPGQRVRAMTYISAGNFHDGMTLIQTRGNVAAPQASAALTSLLPRFDALIAHQTPLAESSSGSPLVDDHGRVVGVNTLSGRKYPQSPPGVNYAQSARSVRALLAQLVPGRRALFEGWSAEHACHREMNRLAGLPPDTSHKNPADMPGMEDGGDEGAGGAGHSHDDTSGGQDDMGGGHDDSGGGADDMGGHDDMGM